MPGGCLDAHGDAVKGYNMQGERVFKPNYVCMYDLFSFIPSLEDPKNRYPGHISVLAHLPPEQQVSHCR